MSRGNKSLRSGSRNGTNSANGSSIITLIWKITAHTSTTENRTIFPDGHNYGSDIIYSSTLAQVRVCPADALTSQSATWSSRKGQEIPVACLQVLMTLNAHYRQRAFLSGVWRKERSIVQDL